MFFSVRDKNNINSNMIIGHNNSKNIYSTVPIQTHAELDGAKKIINKYDGKKEIYNLVLTRFTKSGNYGNSYPCFHCVQQLASFSNYFRIKKLYYTDDNILYEIKFSEVLAMNNTNHLSSGYRFRTKINKKLTN